MISKDYGNLTHGYCLTSYSSQSKGIDCVFIAESAESFRAADREQFYVCASRFKEALTIYTDDKHQLLEAVSKSSQRPSATDLVINQSCEITPQDDSKKRSAQMQAVEKSKGQTQIESRSRAAQNRSYSQALSGWPARPTIPFQGSHDVEGRFVSLPYRLWLR